MNPPVKLHWLSIEYDYSYREVVVMTGISLLEVLGRVSAAQAGRLKYKPLGPRITRIAALKPPDLSAPQDRAFAAMLEGVLRQENDQTVFL